MRRMLLWHILPAALLGLATTVGIAWGLTCRDWNLSTFAHERWNYEWSSAEGEAMILHLNWRTGQSVGVITRRRMSRLPDETPLEFQLAAPPSFLTTHLRQIDLHLQSSAVCNATGWPMLAMHEDTYFDHGRATATNATTAPSQPQVTRTDRGSIAVNLPRIGRRQLPILPVWRGLAVDVIMFAAAWFVALVTPGWVSRRIRACRGLCVHCKYDLRGHHDHARCPECGCEPRIRSRRGR